MRETAPRYRVVRDRVDDTVGKRATIHGVGPAGRESAQRLGVLGVDEQVTCLVRVSVLVIEIGPETLISRDALEPVE